MFRERSSFNREFQLIICRLHGKNKYSGYMNIYTTRINSSIDWYERQYSPSVTPSSHTLIINNLFSVWHAYLMKKAKNNLWTIYICSPFKHWNYRSCSQEASWPAVPTRFQIGLMIQRYLRHLLASLQWKLHGRQCWTWCKSSRMGSGLLATANAGSFITRGSRI